VKKFSHRYTFGDFEYIRKLQTPLNKIFYDISGVHGRYSKEGMASNLGPNAVYITIMRDPIEQFKSFWKFFGLERNFNGLSLDSWILRFPLTFLVLKCFL